MEIIKPVVVAVEEEIVFKAVVVVELVLSLLELLFDRHFT